jgi:hypothetical protein
MVTGDCQMSKKSSILLLCVSASLFHLSTGLQAQDAQRQVTSKGVTAKTAHLDIASTSGSEFSKDVQRALEAGNTRKALQLCGASCRNDPSGKITSGQTGGTRDYQCQNGNCACTSIADCVAMTEICAPGTQGCNDYGCTCQENTEPEPEGG